jgi:uncharacterized protein YbjT (DUF2867 family)
MLAKDSREDYLVLSSKALCQYLLRRDHDALVIARGPNLLRRATGGELAGGI